ncbi:MAG: glycosyltransferase [Lachnospiraceae bacterium]|nr:glycosyltransferase [Lachnospiraceae bacterium]
MRVTIITTCFNAQEHIRKTIESVLRQTFMDYEYIIMDGASKDDTLKIASEYEDAFLRRQIPYHIYSEPDTGIYDGMNHGVKKATGEYVNFMNAGDEFFDEKVLEKLFKRKDYPDIGIIYGDAAETEYGEQYLFVKSISNIKKRMPFSHQSAFALRSLLTEHPFDLKYKIAADYDFIMNCYDEGVKFYDSNLMICRVSKDGVSSVKLYDTFTETEEMLTAHGYPRYTPDELKKKLFFLRIRQFGMDILPAAVKKKIRQIQRKQRGQDIKVDG